MQRVGKLAGEEGLNILHDDEAGCGREQNRHILRGVNSVYLIGAKNPGKDQLFPSHAKGAGFGRAARSVNTEIRLPHIEFLGLGRGNENLVLVGAVELRQVGKQILQVGMAAVRRRREAKNGDLHCSVHPGPS